MAATCLAFEDLFQPSVSPSIPKCPHGVYLAGEKEKARYCLGCYPAGPGETRNVVIPRDSGTSLVAKESRANLRREGYCPECTSAAHIDAGKGKWICADCDTEYPAPRKRSHE